MDFVPNPADVHNYMDKYRSCGFVLGRLPTNVYRETIENSLRRRPGCAGNMTVYWPDVERNHPLQKHRGWCHVLCTSRDLRNIIKGTLNGHKISPQSQACTTKAIRHPIAYFERITRLPVFALGTTTTTTTTTITPVAPVAPVAIASAAEIADTVADEDVSDAVLTLPPREAYKDVRDKVRRFVDSNVTGAPTQTWKRAMELFGEVLELLDARVACEYADKTEEPAAEDPTVPAEATATDGNEDTPIPQGGDDVDESIM
ncbi:hypothetical protein F5Y10DRAFT_290217 [Nemania abortiva]|nr:hypothetical protein F5Y10DRAFT_290217 [Nemania abortiva]